METGVVQIAGRGGASPGRRAGEFLGRRTGGGTRAILAALWLGARLAASEGSEAEDKSRYSLLNPTPRSLLRDLSADRPDATESPFTVDAGRAQVELSFVDYTRDERGRDKVRSWALFDTNLKLGLTHRSDIQVLFTAYGEEHASREGEPPGALTGFGDVTLRLKRNLWGNDSGDTALALLPYVRIPTGTELSNDEVEGGLIATFGWSLSERLSLGGQVQIEAAYDPDRDEYDPALLHTAVLGLDVVGPLGAYIEYIGLCTFGGRVAYIPVLSTGLTWLLTPDAQLDAGLRIGLIEDADDLGVLTGITLRF